MDDDNRAINMLGGYRSQEDFGKQYRDLHKEYHEYVQDWKWHNIGLIQGPDPCQRRTIIISEPKPKPDLPLRTENETVTFDSKED